jgi:ribose 5-phosphate isomerase B
MRVYLGSDHAGYDLKSHLLAHLATVGHEPVDCGPYGYDADDDYPPYCFATASRVVNDPGSLGVVIGGSGNGEQMAANKVPGARAALAWNEETARLAREHNDANLVAIGARMHPSEAATQLVEVFLATPFSGGQRHARRLRMIADYEATGSFDPGEAAVEGGADEPG